MKKLFLLLCAFAFLGVNAMTVPDGPIANPFIIVDVSPSLDTNAIAIASETCDAFNVAPDILYFGMEKSRAFNLPNSSIVFKSIDAAKNVMPINLVISDHIFIEEASEVTNKQIEQLKQIAFKNGSKIKLFNSSAATGCRGSSFNNYLPS